MESGPCWAWDTVLLMSQQASQAEAHGLLCLSWGITVEGACSCSTASVASLLWGLQLQYCSGGSGQGARDLCNAPQAHCRVITMTDLSCWLTAG